MPISHTQFIADLKKGLYFRSITLYKNRMRMKREFSRCWKCTQHARKIFIMCIFGGGAGDQFNNIR